MKLAVIIKILQITGMRISTAQHYRIPDIKGRFSFYCVCSRMKKKTGKEIWSQKNKADWEKRGESMYMYLRKSGDTMLYNVFAATEGPCCIVSVMLNWRPLWLNGTVLNNAVADCRLVHFKDQVHFSPGSLKCRSA